MALNPLRIGRLLGPFGRTLEDLLVALQDINTSLGPAGDLYAKLEAIRDLASGSHVELLDITGALGDTTDCDGATLMSLLCELKTEIVGSGSPPSPPPAFCPGFEGLEYFQSQETQLGTIDGDPAFVYFMNFGSAPAQFPFFTQDEQWAEGQNSNAITFWGYQGSPGTSLPVCIATYGQLEGNNISIRRLVPTHPYSLALVETITPANSDLSYTASFAMQAGTLYTIQIPMQTTNPPVDPRAWIVCETLS